MSETQMGLDLRPSSRVNPWAYPDLSDLAESVRDAWRALLKEPEAADILTIACQRATQVPIGAEGLYLNGDDLLRAVRIAGHKCDNRIRAPLVRYVMAQYPSIASRFHTRKGKVA